MDGLIIGLDLCDTYSQVSCYEEEKAWTIPTVICKKKNTEEWYVGEEAYGFTLMGEGVIVDKLLKLVMKDGTSTIGGVKYEGIDLLKLFLEKVLELPKKEFHNTQIGQLVISLKTIEAKLMDSLMYCADYLNIPRDRIHMISHTESFVYYVLSQKKEVWNNQVGMFDLSEDSLYYYELKVQRGLRKMTVISECQDLEEGFNLDILNNTSGAKLADKILCSCGERLLDRKLFSSIFLTGKGFERQDWAGEFMKMICTRRKVYAESELYSRGAAYRAMDYLQEKTSYPFVCICEGRLHSAVSMKVFHKDKESQLIVADAGDNWYESKSTVELIMDNQKDVEFLITPMDPKNRKLVKIPLEGFPERPNKTTRVSVNVGFLDEKTMAVMIKDKGFGELFPATDISIRQEVRL